MFNSRITKNDSEDIGFVITCIFSSAIDYGELHEWCENIISELDIEEIPTYIFDLINFNDPLMHIYNVIGFVPEWTKNKSEADAVLGIAVYRNRLAGDAPISEEKAIQSLKEHPIILERFKTTFPFVKLDI